MPKPKKKTALAEAVSYAHLLPAVTQASARAAEDDDDEDKDRTDAEDGDDEEDKKPAGKKAKKARADDQGNDDGEDDSTDDDGDDPDADDDDGEDGDNKPSGKKAKKAKSKADDGGDDDEDDNGENDDDASARAGAMRERARCAAIFGSRHAAGRPDLAAHLAFSTNMSAREAIGTMKTLVGGEKAGARSTRSTLADRMHAESVPNPGQGASAAPTGAKGLAAAMLAASKKASGG